MLLCKTICRKVFDLVEIEQDVKNKLEDAFSNDAYKSLINDFKKQGKIKKRTQKFEQDQFDNWVYTSITIYKDIQAYNECFEYPEGQAIMEQAIKAGFEFIVEFKEVNEILEKQIENRNLFKR